MSLTEKARIHDFAILVGTWMISLLRSFVRNRRRATDCYSWTRFTEGTPTWMKMKSGDLLSPTNISRIGWLATWSWRADVRFFWRVNTKIQWQSNIVRHVLIIVLWRWFWWYLNVRIEQRLLTFPEDDSWILGAVAKIWLPSQRPWWPLSPLNIFHQHHVSFPTP